MDYVRQEIVKIAGDEVGPQVKGSPQVVAYCRDVLPPSWSDAMVRQYAKAKEWCGIFALWCLRRAGLAASVHWLDGIGFLGPAKLPRTLSPEPGDIAYFAAPFQHHAVVVSWERIADKERREGASTTWLPRWRLVTIDGNQPDVKERVREIVPAEKPGPLFYSIEPLLRAEAPTLPEIPPLALDTIRRGSTGPDVRTLQMRLALTVDGSFGPKTEAAVQAFQRAHGLTPDGVVGPKTWAALGLS